MTRTTIHSQSGSVQVFEDNGEIVVGIKEAHAPPNGWHYVDVDPVDARDLVAAIRERVDGEY